MFARRCGRWVAFAVVAVWGPGRAGGVCMPDMAEPDSSPAEAKVLTSGSAGRMICPSGDVDWFSFTGTPTDEATVALSNVGGSRPSVFFEIYTASGSLVKRSDPNGSVTFEMAESSYYVRATTVEGATEGVFGAGGGGLADATYQIGLGFGPECGTTPDEPNEDYDAATAVAAGSFGATICRNRDVDWYSFAPAMHDEVTVSLADVTGERPSVVFDVFRRADGSLVAQSTTNGSVSFEADTTDYRVRVIGEEDGVRAVWGSGGGGLADATYTLGLEFAPVCGPDVFEPNPDFDHAAPMPEGWAFASICRNRDVDWYSLAPAMHDEVTVWLTEVEGTRPSVAFDVFRRADGSLVASSEANGSVSFEADATDLRVRVYGTEEGTAAVWGAGGGGLGYATYVLNVGILPDCGEDVFEPNPWYDQSTPIAEGTTKATICRNRDVDWYSFQTAMHDEVTVSLAEVAGSRPSVAFDVFRRVNGSLVATSDANGSATFEADTTDWRVRVYGTEDATAAVWGPGGGGLGETEYALGVALLPDCAPDAFEPNTFYDQSAAIAEGTVDGTICRNRDVDWFSFQTAMHDEVTVELRNVTGSRPALAFDVFRRVNGTLVATSPTNGSATFEADTTDWRVRVYGTEEATAAVWGAGGGGLGDATYTLAVELLPDCGADMHEPNAEYDQSAAMADGVVLSASICRNRDVDWYSFQPAMHDEVTVALLDVAGPRPALAFDVFRRLNGTLVATSPANGSVTFEADTTDYRVRVYGTEGATAAVWGAGGGGLGSATYGVRADFAPSCSGDQHEPNPDYDQSTALGSVPLQASICRNRDVDWYSFQPAMNDTVTIALSNVAGTRPSVAFDVFRRGDGSLVATSAANGSATFPADTTDYRVRVYGTTDGVAGVWGAGGGGLGYATYRLSLRAVPPSDLWEIQ